VAELQSSLPLIDLPSGAQIVLEAIDPATGQPVAGVVISNVAITYEATTNPKDAPELPAALAFSPTV